MILHLGDELPQPACAILDAESPGLTPGEVRILKDQIRKNSVWIHDAINQLDLLVNKERYPPRAVFIERIRRRLGLLMEENDTFRRVLWNHLQTQDLSLR